MNVTRTTAINRSRVLIVDDHPIVREGLAARIARQPDLTVCGEAEDVADRRLELVKSTNPDLVIVDLSLKSGQGLDFDQTNTRVLRHDEDTGVLDVRRIAVRRARRVPAPSDT